MGKNGEKRKNRLSDDTKKAVLFTLVIVLSLALIGVCIAYALTPDSQAAEAEKYKTQLENSYQEAFLDLVTEVDNIEVRLAKLSVSASASLQQKLLHEVWKSAEAAVGALSHLSGTEQTVTDTTKFVNQTGDYCLFLSNAAAKGKTLEDAQLDTLEKMRTMYEKLAAEFARVHDEIRNGYLFLDSPDGGIVGEVFSNLTAGSVDYPQMIYDGPFSDSLAKKDVKGLYGAEIDEAAGRELIYKYLPEYEITEIEFEGEYESDLPTFNYFFKLNGRVGYIQLAKTGGSIILLTVQGDCNESKFDEKACVKIAEDYLAAQGYCDMKAVWVSNYEGLIYINLAPVVDGVVVYPDLIKVKICSETGDIIGFDSINHAFNNTKRTLEVPVLSHDAAKAKVSDRLKSMDDGRLALIPLEDGSERLTYEFSASLDGSYLIYIDAKTGEEVNILFVIDSEDGSLLI